MTRIPHILVSQPAESAEAQCDCACPDGGFAMRPSRAPDSARWEIAPALHRAALPDDHELIFNPYGHAYVIALDQAARSVLATFQTPGPIADTRCAGVDQAAARTAAAQLAALGVLRPEGQAPALARSQPHTLTAWLHLTNACNLRCTYCYVAKTDEAMDEATGRQAIEAIFRSATRHQFQAVKLKYAGGEATLNFGLLRTLHRYAVELSERSGIALRAVVLSNGVALTRAMLQFLQSERIHLMISIDGIGEAHDRQRMFPHGRGSSAHALRGVARAIEAGVVPDLSITVTGESAAALPETVGYALEHQLRFNLNFCRPSGRSDLTKEGAQILAGVRAALAYIRAHLPPHRIIDGLIDRSSFGQPHEYACGAGRAYLAINQRGGVSRCHMALEHTIASVYSIDPLLDVCVEPGDYRFLPVDEREGCRACIWRYWCAGGCPALTYSAAGRDDVRSPYCDVYRALYPEILYLEGLRLLAYNHSARALAIEP